MTNEEKVKEKLRRRAEAGIVRSALLGDIGPIDTEKLNENIKKCRYAGIVGSDENKKDQRNVNIFYTALLDILDT